MNITLQDIETAARLIYEIMPPTPQYRWPLLCERLGTDVWVKHENHTPVGAFKIRGGLVYFDHLAREETPSRGVISATRGNHGQSIGFAARRHEIPATIVVPHGNSREKNAAMRALGVTLVEHGADFQQAREHAEALAASESLHLVPAFHPLLVTGAATYSLELFRAVPELDTVYVPIGLGSGICGMLAARDALGLNTAIVGVVSSHADAYGRSYRERRVITAPAHTRLGDGVAVSVPEPAALEMIWNGVDRVIEVTDTELAAAMCMLYECTHNVSEGAGAAALAGAVRERNNIAGRRIAVIQTGGNIDRDLLAGVLAGEPVPAYTP